MNGTPVGDATARVDRDERDAGQGVEEHGRSRCRMTRRAATHATRSAASAATRSERRAAQLDRCGHREAHTRSRASAVRRGCDRRRGR
jgi:hypothetical protein